MAGICRNGIFVRCTPLFKSKSAFDILGVRSNATKVQIKSAYRQLAKRYHPDAEGGDAKQMEEINQAYKFLLKEGGYEQLHQRREEGRGGARKAPVYPFSPESEDREGGSRGPKPMTDEEMKKWSALDPTTERRTPEGKYIYQSRDDGSWVEVDRPLIRADQPRYASFFAHADMIKEMRRRQMMQEKENNEKSSFQRNMDKLADSADLPSRNPHFLRFYFVALMVVFYMMYKRTFARPGHQRKRSLFYMDVENKREELLQLYTTHSFLVEDLTAAAAIVLLAASRKKLLSTKLERVLEDEKEEEETFPAVTRPVLVYDAIHPPPSHFHVHAGG